ncbi:hypothetical protein P167DRAFT_175243 [Morchella conica CCBAS932]|uniref:Uncharacterized protein n=1 Tax=Morchella conica CCBAS932 TaxID=1392247 RepID=A0A3N4KNE7_9PEZI|nr:hypothetical protein P167DRAFT_175243 [Morchella conica CCBAS932]
MAEHSIYSTSTGFHPLCLLVAPFSRIWNTPTGSRPALIPSHQPACPIWAPGTWKTLPRSRNHPTCQARKRTHD